MSETRKMQLHLGKCIDDLDKLHNVPDLKAKRATVLCKTAQKLFEKAEESWLAGDEEYAYVYYMKYLRVVAFLSKEKEYLKDKTYYTSMLGPKNPNKAIDMAEKLKNSLIERYGAERQQPSQASPTDAEAMPAEQPVTAPAQLDYDLPGIDEVTIYSEQLFPLLKSGKMRVMILDARPGRDFDESHLNHPACISVPEEVISPGQSANVLEQKLPPASRQVWSERASAALVVIMDWSSTTVIPGKPLFLLKTILLKWDVKVQYARPPLCLWGGYEDWLLKYPAMTTNPHVQLPAQQQLISDMLEMVRLPLHVSDDEEMGKENANRLTALFHRSIEYPSWEEATVTPPDTAPQPPRPKGSEPVVDRSSKAAAVQMYEERAQLMQAILEQQEYIADTSLSLELRRIEAERDWERIRLQGETEKRLDLRAMYKLREQEIISQLMQLENKQFDMEQENLSLREQLEEYQRREREEAERRAEEIASKQPPQDSQRLRVMEEMAAREMANKAARIAAMTHKRAALDQQREELETQRKRKLAEARRNRKPAIYSNKDEEVETYLWSGDGEGSEGTPSLTRSQSSPNIAQQSEEMEPTTPAFDRSAKPRPRNERDEQRERMRQAERVRNFDAIPGDVGRGLTGLRNLGNTCYMNSIIQCLNNTTLLVTYFCNGQYMDHIDRSTATRGEVAEELAAVVRALWSGQYKHIGAKDFRHALGKQQRTFRDPHQQDSHEFLTILMDYLHLDLRFTIDTPPKETLAPPERAWLEWTKAKESLILKLFYGQIKSTVRCTVCARASVTYETFSNLSLEMPADGNRCSLHDCLKLYLTGEAIHGWNCPWCKEKREAVKKLDISRLPPVLVIHFKRFFMNHSVAEKPKCEKKMTYIDFPLSNLDMRPYSLHQPANTVYDLYAISNHYGSTTSGHYTALCKSSVYGKWFLYDDHAVRDASERDVKSSAAYILFYTSYRNA